MRLERRRKKGKGLNHQKRQRDENLQLIAGTDLQRDMSTKQPHTLLSEYILSCTQAGVNVGKLTRPAFPLHLHTSTWLLPCGGWSPY